MFSRPQHDSARTFWNGYLASVPARRVLVALGSVGLLALVLAMPALAKRAPITGKLSKPGYTVIALGYGGKATTINPGKRSFKLVPPEANVTLQLRDKRGKYAGPVVVGGTSSRVIEGVRAGAKLGTIKVLSGYARPAHRIAKKYVDGKRVAQAKKGVPLGNGRNFGLVRSREHGKVGKGRDQDLDGVPDALDIDADGNKVIDPLQAKAVRERGVARSAQNLTSFGFMSQMFFQLAETLNADAAGVTLSEINSTMVDKLTVATLNVPAVDLVELDCTGLVYCSPGGIGQVGTTNGPDPDRPVAGDPVPFPSCCDPDGNGFGNIRGPGAIHATPGKGGGLLKPNATSSQIGSGDTLILRAASAGVLTQTPVAIDFVFNTVPALSSYSDGAGNAGTLTYPASAGAPGTQGNPLPVAANGSGEVVLNLKFWRPQRKGISGAGEPTFMDIGHLGYALGLANANPVPSDLKQPYQKFCGQSSLSTSDHNLAPTPFADFGAVTDGANDAPSDSHNTLSFSLNLTKCFQSKRVSGSGVPVGTEVELELATKAQTSFDHASQLVWVKRIA